MLRRFVTVAAFLVMAGLMVLALLYWIAPDSLPKPAELLDRANENAGSMLDG
ncbi:MAG: hypothetical protein ABJO41_02015 [Erythrobacter sp.]